jgi:protein phosphatase
MTTTTQYSKVVVATKSDKGRRPYNEDASLVLGTEELGGYLDALLIVADGMGGRASGHIASSLAVKSIRDNILSLLPQMNQEPLRMLSQALQLANETIYRESLARTELAGMGTTCVVACIKGNHAFIAHLGDSRAYLFHDGQLSRLTEDHSFVAEKVKSGEITEEEARRSRFRNVITRALGLEPEVVPDTRSVELHPGDLLLLCTDGLSVPVADTEIASILGSSPDAYEACINLIRAALKNGGADNITVAIAACEKQLFPVYGIAKPRTRLVPLLVICSFLSILLGFLGGNVLPVRDLLFKRAAPGSPGQKVAEVKDLRYGKPVALYFAPIRNDLLVADRQGCIYVADIKGRLIRLDSSGQVLYRFAERELFKGESEASSAMFTVDKWGNLYVSNPREKCIFKYGPDGILVAVIGKGMLARPGAIAVGRDGSIYIIDDRRLKVFRPITLPAKSD